MQTKFRSIALEKERKSTDTDTTPLKLVKPIAIPALTTKRNEIQALPLHVKKHQSDPLFNLIPNGLASSISTSSRNPDVSSGLRGKSLDDQRCAPWKQSPSTTEAVNGEGEIVLPEDRQTSYLKKRSHLVSIEREGEAKLCGSETRSEKTNSTKQAVSLNGKDEGMSQSMNTRSESCFARHAFENKRLSADCFITPSSPDIAGHVKNVYGSDPQLRFPRVNTCGKTSPDTDKKLELEAGRSLGKAPVPRFKEGKESPSNGTFRFSDILDSEDSSKSDHHESFDRKENGQDPALPLSSHSSSSGEPDNQTEVSSSKIRKASSGKRVSPRRMEKSQGSQAGSEDSNENPWFHSKSFTEEQDINEEPKSIDDETLKSEKGKKKRSSRFTRFFRSAKLENSIPEKSTGSSPEEASLRQSISDSSSILNEDISPKRDAAEEHLEDTLSLSISGKRSLEEVIDALLGLSGRPHDSVMKLLMKYMGSTIVIDDAFRIILEHEHAKKMDIPMKNMKPTHPRCSPRRDALINLFASGPDRLQKALLSHNKAKSEILRFFTDERPAGFEEIPYWIATATNLSKILNGLLRQFPFEITEYIGGKKGVLHLMIKHHVHVPEVVDFVVQLSAANALSKTTGDELRYGAANAAGLVLLAKEGICDLLVDIFKRSSAATAQGSAHLLEWQTQLMSTQCLLELSKRAIFIPRFTKDNCSYSSRYIKVLNSSLKELSLFTHESRVLSLLNSAFEAVSDGPEIENAQEQSKRNNPLVCVLAVIIDLLETVHTAAGSKLAVTRKTVGSTDTAKIEKHLVSKLARLCRLLHRKSAHEVSSRAKVAIVNLFRCLSYSKLERTRLSMVKSQIPDRLMMLIRENSTSSVLHSCVLKCLTAAFDNEQCPEVHKEWLCALARNGGWLQVMYEYFQKVNGGDAHGRGSLFSTFVEIGFQLLKFSQDDREMKLRPMLKSRTELQTFATSVEAGLFRIRQEYETPCGGPKPEERAVSVLANAETLAARLHDFNAV